MSSNDDGLQPELAEINEKLRECDAILSSLSPSYLKDKLTMTQETLRSNSCLIAGSDACLSFSHIND